MRMALRKGHGTSNARTRYHQRTKVISTAAVHAAQASLTAQVQARQWAGMQLYEDVAQAFYTRLAAQKDQEVLEGELPEPERRLREGVDFTEAGELAALAGAADHCGRLIS